MTLKGTLQPPLAVFRAWEGSRCHTLMRCEPCRTLPDPAGTLGDSPHVHRRFPEKKKKSKFIRHCCYLGDAFPARREGLPRFDKILHHM